MYLAFCGLAISNAQAIESYRKEYNRNKVQYVIKSSLIFVS